MAAKTALSLVPTAYAAPAIKAKKLPRSKVLEVSWDEMKKHVLLQVLDDPKLNQRLANAQVDAGMWDHIKGEPLSTQCTFEVVQVVRRGVRGRRKQEYILVDGYHRIYYWHMHCNDECPFEGLNMIVHEVVVDASATQEDIDERVDALARSINSKKSAKDNADFLTAAVRDAGMRGPIAAESNAYKFGSRAVCMMKRVIGDPAKLSGPKLRAAAGVHLSTHIAMDGLFRFTETHRYVKPAAKQLFHAGVAVALFESLAAMPSDAARGSAVTRIKQALEYAATPDDAIANLAPSLTAPVNTLVECLRKLADPKVDAELHAGKNQEQFYTAVANEMRPALAAISRAAIRETARTVK